MNKENIDALDEINKGTCMGMDALNFVMDKVEDKEFKAFLKDMYSDYKKIGERVESVYPEYNEGKPHETNLMNKAMTWSGIEMKTMNDTSNSKIAELLLQGVNMGIIEGRKILNKKNIDNQVNDIISNYVTMQESSVEVLTKYL